MREIHDHKAPGDSPMNLLQVTAADDLGAGGAPALYTVWDRLAKLTPLIVKFQEGNPKDGINGVTHEALLAIVIDRLEHFQRGPFPSEESNRALIACRAALSHLHMRTSERIARGVEGQTKP